MASIKRTDRAGLVEAGADSMLLLSAEPSWALHGVFLHLSSHSAMLSGRTGFANTLLSTALDICVPVMSTPIPSSLLMSFQCGISHLFLGESASEERG